MSFFLKGQDQRNNLLQSVLAQIDNLMISQFKAEKISLENKVFYCTANMIMHKKLDFYWRFQPYKSTAVKLCIRPNILSGNGINFRIQTQRSITDLLKIIHRCNSDKDRLMSFYITEKNSIQMCTSFQLVPGIKDYQLRKVIQNTHDILPSIIQKLQSKLQPFFQYSGTENQQKNLSQTAKRFLDYSYRFIVLSKYNQIQNSTAQRGQATFSYIQKEIEQSRIDAYRIINGPFKVMGNKQTFLKHRKDSVISSYSQWLRRKSKQTDQKNVVSIQILQQTQKPLSKQNGGTHCKIFLKSFKVKVMLSVNPGLDNPIKKEEPNLANATSESGEKKLQLVSKIVKDKNKISSKNSFENELDFIMYIKQRNCKYVGNYYWVFGKSKVQMQAILMNYYPQNLKELLQNQGRLLSFGSKLDILYRITKSIKWISSQHVCHRDIKPQNIMIDEQRRPKLIDFGSCCPANGIGSLYFSVKQSRLLGTPNYYYPYDEQTMKFAYSRNQYEQHTLFDAFSLGRVMRDMFEDGLPNLLPNLSGFLNYIIERCEQQDPMNRLTYQQIEYFLFQFIRYLDWLEKDD